MTTATCPGGEDGSANENEVFVAFLHLIPTCASFREEWQWLQALSSLEESLEMDHDVQSAPHRLLQDLRGAIKDLMAHINVPGNQVRISSEPSRHKASPFSVVVGLVAK